MQTRCNIVDNKFCVKYTFAFINFFYKKKIYIYKKQPKTKKTNKQNKTQKQKKTKKKTNKIRKEKKVLDMGLFD